MKKIVKLTENELKEIVNDKLAQAYGGNPRHYPSSNQWAMGENEEKSSYNYVSELDNIYDGFKALEEEYNKYDLNQLKWDYKLSIILDKLRELQTKFKKIKDVFYKNDENLSDEIEDKIFALEQFSDNLIEDLENMEELFRKMGDLDRGSHWFKHINLDSASSFLRHYR